MGLESIQDFFNRQIRNVASNNLAENITNNMQNSNIKFDANQMTTFFLFNKKPTTKSGSGFAQFNLYCT